MKIAAVVILYHPPQNVISNIESYYDFVDEIYVFDNSETPSETVSSFSSLSKIRYHHDSQNLGIAKRLNAACELALKKGFHWILTMDQDTCFSGDAINIYFNCFKQYKEKTNVAMFGTGFKRGDCWSDQVCTPQKAYRLITSGMLLNLSMHKKIGGFDELLFIDLVDDEYCIAATKAGYAIIQFKNVCLSHNLGKEVYRSSIKSLYLLRKKKEIHSPLRCYYMYRNMLYIQEKYKGTNIKLVKEIRKIVVSHIKVCMLYGGEGWKIIKYLFAARRDFSSFRMGRIEKEM